MLSVSSALENILQDCHTSSHWVSCSPWQAMPWDIESLLRNDKNTELGLHSASQGCSLLPEGFPGMTGMLPTCSGCWKTKEQLQVTVVQHKPQSFSSTLRLQEGEGGKRLCWGCFCWIWEIILDRNKQINSAKIPAKVCMYTPLTPQLVEGKTQDIKTQQHH